MKNTSIANLFLPGILSQSALISGSGDTYARFCSFSRSFSSLTLSRSGFSSYYSSFSAFLSTVIIYERECQSSEYFSQVIPNSSLSTFCSCRFVNISQTSAQGSCVYCTSSLATQFNGCIFMNCTSFQSGSAGCIMSDGAVYVTHCCFELCYLSTTTANIYTNVIYSTGTNLNVSTSFFHTCGPSNAVAGDSTIFTKNSIVSMDNSNYTQCAGTEGGASISAWYSPSGTAAKYISVIQCGQWCSLELADTYAFAASYFNVVNNTKFTHCYINNYQSVSTLSYFVFALNGAMTEYISVSSPSTITVSNFVSDVSFTSATYQSSPTTFCLSSISNQGCKNWATQVFTPFVTTLRVRSGIVLFGLSIMD